VFLFFGPSSGSKPFFHFGKRYFEISIISFPAHPPFRAIDKLELINGKD
jgi:hypothetical protein